MACMLYPELMKDSTFPDDVKDRANEILDSYGNRSLGSYTPSNGNLYIRSIITKFLKIRDEGVTANPDDIVVTMGAADAIQKTLQLIAIKQAAKPTGVLVPIPSYPLYNATVVMNGMAVVGYYLDENHNWDANVLEMKRALEKGKAKCNPRALVIVNPNNPTGSLLSEKTIKEIIQFAYEEQLLVIADEVYQFNVYEDKFHSFKKCQMKMGEPYSSRELISFCSLSKGIVAEAGLRGGFMEVLNFYPEVRATFYKMITATLCPPTTSQSLLAMSLKPPKPDSPSYRKFKEETDFIKNNLKERALEFYQELNKLEGVKCTKIRGSMFAFPSIPVSAKAMEDAKSRKLFPDEMYCIDLLEETGICIMPGMGFGQRPGTYHLRMAMLPSKELFHEMMSRLRKFHKKWVESYGK